MSLLAQVHQPNADKYYFALEGADATFDDITCNTITVNGESGASVNVNGGDLIMSGGRIVASTDPLLPGMSATPIYRINSNGYMLVNNGYDSTARLYMGPAPSGGNNDYCSLISATNTASSNYGSDLGFWTHSTVSNYGDPIRRMTIDNTGNVGILTGSLDVSGMITFNGGKSVLSSQTALVSTAQQQPINISAGVNSTNIGTPFTVTKSGLYILTGAFTYDGGAPDGITFGSADFLAVRLNPTGVGVSQGVNVNLRNCVGNNDGISSATLVVPLVAGTTYQAVASMYNISGVSTITGSPIYGAAYAVTALC